MEPLNKTIERLSQQHGTMTPEELAKPQKKKPEQKPEKPKSAEVIRFPIIPEDKSAIPNDLARSSLFGVVARGAREENIRDLVLAAQGDIKITYTGDQLDQSDLDVWLYLIGHFSGTEEKWGASFTSYDCLKSIGRNSTGGSSYNWLLTTLKRLKRATIEYQNGSKGYYGSLINEILRDDEKEILVVHINPSLLALFGKDAYTNIVKSERQNIKSALGQWLHAYFSTHAKPYPIKVKTLQSLCGSKTDKLWKFRQQLKKSLLEIESITGWQCNIDDRDCVNIKKKHTKALSS